MHIPIHVEKGENFERRIYRFNNQYGASVAKGSHISGYEEDLWDLIVIKFYGELAHNFGFNYNNPASNYAVGHLSDEDVEEYLHKIKNINIRRENENR